MPARAIASESCEGSYGGQLPDGCGGGGVTTRGGAATLPAPWPAGTAPPLPIVFFSRAAIAGTHRSAVQICADGLRTEVNVLNHLSHKSKNKKLRKTKSTFFLESAIRFSYICRRVLHAPGQEALPLQKLGSAQESGLQIARKTTLQIPGWP